jgi:hypothetical protein
MQESLNTIMELCESKMNENDYLIVTGHLKQIYDENKKKSAKKVVKVHRILNDEVLRANPTATFELTNDEKKYIMDNRLKLQYKDMIDSINEEIRNIADHISKVKEAKKLAFDWSKQLRYSYSPDRENAIYEHKKMVQREKGLKIEMKALKVELVMIRALL